MKFQLRTLQMKFHSPIRAPKCRDGTGIGGKAVKEMKNKSIVISAAAVFLLLTLTVRMGVAYGAVGIETDMPCSITFDINTENLVPQGDVLQEDFAELLTSEVPDIVVKLYKVADVNSVGEYQMPTGAGADVSLYDRISADLGSVSSETAAEQWLAMAEAAAEAVTDASVPAASGSVVREGVDAGKVRISDLAVGLYLVMADDVQSAEYTYSFLPYLVSLPDNQYYRGTGNDEWIYDVNVSLKPGREICFGNLEIRKTLGSYNETLGGATCVFQIEAKKGNTVYYSDVKSIVFDTAGTKSITIEGKIPAGAEVTVTEVYSGAGYEVVSSSTQTPDIIAGETAAIDFGNEYSGQLNGGTSVENYYGSTVGEDGREWTIPPVQLRDSTLEPETSGSGNEGGAVE